MPHLGQAVRASGRHHAFMSWKLPFVTWKLTLTDRDRHRAERREPEVARSCGIKFEPPHNTDPHEDVDG